MKIYGVLVVKNEADCLREVIESALKWVNKIFVVDNNSSDGTLDVIRGFDERVILVSSTYLEFVEGLRNIVINYLALREDIENA